MTYLEALKAKVEYPLSDNAYTLALEDRGLTSTDTYVKGKLFDLAYADCLTQLVTMADKKESNFSISITEKRNLIKLANGIYSKYGIVSSLKPTAKFVSRW
jgi:hypothetical protein